MGCMSVDVVCELKEITEDSNLEWMGWSEKKNGMMINKQFFPIASIRNAEEGNNIIR